MTIDELVKESHETAKSKGWWDQEPERSFPEQIALMHSELSEALEDYRIFGLDKEEFLAFFTNEPPERHSSQSATGHRKPCGLATEFADVLIRIADTCGKYGIPLEQALVAKLAYNKTRAHRHGGKKC